MSFCQFNLSSIISLELCLGMFDHTQHSGHSSVCSLRITTVLGKGPLHVPTVFHYKTEDNHCTSLWCVHILSTCPSGVSLRVGVALLECYPHRRSNSTQKTPLTTIFTTLSPLYDTHHAHLLTEEY